jgi:hypothetical protein
MSINLKGGLGNQLFQIFSLMGIAKKNDYKYILDKSYTDNRKTYWDNILSEIPNCENKLLKMHEDNTENVINETSEIHQVNENRSTQYLDITLNKDEMRNVFLKGYFQSFNYFENIRDNVFDILIKNQNGDIMKKVNEIYHKLKTKYQNKKLVYIHRRSGDYTDPIHKGYYAVLPMNYYKEALKNFDQNECAFIIFSDVPNQCKDEFSFIKNKEIIQEEDYIELLLMSKMDGAIIANSTFSAWGAYLMDYYRCKTVVCPKYWFTEWDIHRFDCMEKHWIFVENTEMFRNVSVDPRR